MSNTKITIAERKIMREKGKEFLKRNPSVKDCVEAFIKYGELKEYLEIISKKETPNIKNIRWFKFLKENFTYDFRDELNYDFEELIELIEM